MKRIALIFGLLAFSGCATTSHEVMQPDHSYKIVAESHSYTGVEGMKEEAYRKATLLCPNGYDTQTEFQSENRKYTMIVLCKSTARIPAAGN